MDISCDKPEIRLIPILQPTTKGKSTCFSFIVGALIVNDFHPRMHFGYFLQQLNACVYIRELSEVCCVEVQLLRQPLHQVRALVSSEGAGGETETAGRHIRSPISIRETCSYSSVKMLFFRDTLPQFRPTNGSLHTSKDYGRLSG